MSENVPDKSQRRQLSVADYASGIRQNDRATLARGITLIESAREIDRQLANQLLDDLLPGTGNSLRIGISGVPGVGKSTFIESFGLHLIDAGHRVAVLAVDPTSSRTGGSILGDKTRMQHLSRHDKAFVRPSPTGGELGGVARTSRESILLCEAAGYDIVLVETVGVGQSEVVVDSMVDCFLVLMLPGAGDELQGIKKGIIEVADLLVVNKADPDDDAKLTAARQAALLYQRALDIITPRSEDWKPRSLTCSALHGDGISEVWQSICEFKDTVSANNELQQRRSKQQHQWMWSQLEERLLVQFKEHAGVQKEIEQLRNAIDKGELTPSVAADRLLAIYHGK